MPEKKTLERAREDAREGKSPSTQAGEFVREEIHHVREGKHGARSAKQAIAIGLSKARKAGVDLPPRRRKGLKANLSKNQKRSQHRPSAKRSQAISEVLQKESHRSVSPGALSRQARQSANRRGATNRHQAALKAVRTKGHEGLRVAARKGARTRQKAA